MSKEKQIKDQSEVLYGGVRRGGEQIEEMSLNIQDAVGGCSSYWSRTIAEKLFGLGYHRQSDDGLILTFDGATGFFPKELIVDAIKAYQKQSEGENVATYPSSAFECSECHWQDWDLLTADSAYNFCPNCGAKMKGGEE